MYLYQTKGRFLFFSSLNIRKHPIKYTLYFHKINCVTHYFSVENSSVGERAAPRGWTTRPDERKITII